MSLTVLAALTSTQISMRMRSWMVLSWTRTIRMTQTSCRMKTSSMLSKTCHKTSTMALSKKTMTIKHTSMPKGYCLPTRIPQGRMMVWTSKYQVRCAMWTVWTSCMGVCMWLLTSDLLLRFCRSGRAYYDTFHAPEHDHLLICCFIHIDKGESMTDTVSDAEIRRPKRQVRLPRKHFISVLISH